MKKLLLTLTAFIASCTIVLAQEVIQKYNFGNITEIDAGYVFDIYVTKGKTTEVEVICPKDMEDRIEVTHNNFGKLILRSIENKRPKRNAQDLRITVNLKMNEVKEIDLSGAAKLYIEGQYTTDELEIDMSGASSIPSLDVKCNELSIDCSGATRLNLTGEYKDIELESSGACHITVLSEKPVNEAETDISGACKINLHFDAQKIDGEHSGACNLNIKGNYNNLKLEGSGASKLTLIGSVSEYMELESSGACKINAEKMVAQNAKINITGVTVAEVNVKNNLTYEVSRTSKLTYHGNPKNITDLSQNTNVIKAD